MAAPVIARVRDGGSAHPADADRRPSVAGDGVPQGGREEKHPRRDNADAMRGRRAALADGRSGGWENRAARYLPQVIVY